MAGKKFAAEFALRRNVSAQDKILIQDSDDDVVKYAYPPQIASLSGYAYAQSVADLPLLPSNKSIGYIVGQMLYIYVGMGGDTKDGLYQSVGFFVGPQGVQGEKGEKGEQGEQGVQGPKGDNGGLSLQELDDYLATKQYVTGDTLADMLAGYVSNTSLMRDYVTIAKAQDVTGVKNFTAGVQFGGLPMYKSKDDTVYLDANLVVRGAVTMYGMNTTTSPSIFSALPIDGTTIGRNERGELYVIGGTSGGGSGTGGGISIADVESYLTTNGYATQSWVTDRGYITSSALEPYALKASIPTNTNQLTNGAGFITASAIPTSLKNPNALSWSGYSTGSYDGSTAQNIALPTKLSQLTDDVVSGKYLPLTGGTISGNLAIGGATALDKLHVYGAISSENTNADAGFRARGSTYALFFGIGSGNVNRGIYDDYYKSWWIMRGADKTTTIDGSMVASGLRINQTAFNNGLTLNRTSANAGAGIVFQSNGSLLGQIGINGTKTFEVSDGTTIKASIEIPTGNMLIKGALTMFYSSDKRLKQNIRKVNASKVLMSLGGVYQYEYINSEVAKNSTYSGSHFGLIYQNVKGTALDKMCHEREDGFGTLNYLDTNFISLIAGATMENCTEIEKLKKENKTLRKEVEQLKQRLS